MNDSQLNVIESNYKDKNIFIDVTKWKKEYLSKKSVRCKDRFETIDHPLVTSGYAYWVDDNTLCIGSRT